MTDIARRELLELMAAIPLLRARWERSRSAHPPVGLPAIFFTPTELATVRMLADLLVPRDEHSGSATDAGVPDFLDFVLTEWPEHQTPIRGGLAWLDRECVTRFDKTFVNCTDAERTQVLDAIAWPQTAARELSHGVAFFNSFRDLTASGFWTSRMGIKDINYTGNVYVPEWKGCPDEAMKKLGL